MAIIKLKCKCCGEDIDTNSFAVTEDGDLICHSCADKKYVPCRYCGKYIPKEFGRWVCNECESSIYTNAINGYSTKPTPRFKNKLGVERDIGNRYYGMELEFSYVKPELAKALFPELYKNKMIYNKSDASLDCGVEIVTNPCDMYTIKTLLSSMQNGLDVINQIPNHTIRAGVHIHVNRKSIGAITIYKLGYLLNNRWEYKDRQFLMYLSGRIKSINSSGLGDDYCHTGTQYKFSDFGRSVEDRHIALNCNNDNTIEFRIYKSSANVDVLKSYVDTTYLLIEFCSSTSIKDININNFALYILEHSKNKLLLDKVNEYLDKKEKVTNTYKIDTSYLENIPEDKLLNTYYALGQVGSFTEYAQVLTSLKGGGVYTDCGTNDYIKNDKHYKKIEEQLKEFYINKILETVGA